LLLVSAGIGDVGDDAVGRARGDFAKYRQIDVTDLLTKRETILPGTTSVTTSAFNVSLAMPRYPLVRRHVIVVTAVTRDDIAVVHRAVVRRVERNPARRR